MMANHKKQILAVTVLSILIFSGTVLAGSLEPTAPPSDDGNAMYTLDALYKRLNAGTAGAKRTGGFMEPASAPATSGRTTNDIMSKMPEVDNSNGAERIEVCEGKTFWSLRSDGTWGLNTGTRPCPRFEDLGDGTVKDFETNLIWLKDTNTIGRATYYDAVSQVATLDETDHVSLTDGSSEGDWRLPSQSEWESFIDRRFADPVLCNTAGTARYSYNDPFIIQYTSMYYWTSTGYYSQMIVLDLSNGNITAMAKDQFYGMYVWPVRNEKEQPDGNLA